MKLLHFLRAAKCRNGTKLLIPRTVFRQPSFQARNIRHFLRPDVRLEYPIKPASITLRRNFSISPTFSAKYFAEQENDYAHRVMETKKEYAKTLAYPINKSNVVSANSDNALIRKFIKTSKESDQNNFTLADPQFTDMAIGLSRIIRDMSDDEVLLMIHCLCMWPPCPKSFTPNYKLLWNTLDACCVKRLPSWTLHRKLLVADYFYCLHLNRISQYNRRMIHNLLNDLNSLSDSQIVQLMFYINLQRFFDSNKSHELEKRLNSVILNVTIEEIGIICLGFFKTKTTISNFSIINHIVQRYINENKNLQTMTANAILKFLKKTRFLEHTDNYIPVLDHSISHVPNWDVPTSIHLALLASDCNVYNPHLLDTVTEKVISNVEDARLKDCMKLLQVLSHFNHPPPDIFYTIFHQQIENSERTRERENFPRDLVYSTLYSSYLGKYNYNHLEKIFNPQFMQQCLALSPESKYSFAEICTSVMIECPDYNGMRPNQDYLAILKQRQGNWPDGSNHNFQTRITYRILTMLRDIVGDDNVLVRHVLPHCFSPDIVVRIKQNNSESMSFQYSQLKPEIILRPPPNESWVVFVPASPFAFCFKSKHPIGNTAMKLRQLLKLGYKVVFLPFYEIPISDTLCRKLLCEKLSELQTEKDSLQIKT